MAKLVSELVPSPRLLLGPGPSLVHPRVLRAMSTPLLGHLDPEFLTIMNEVPWGQIVDPHRLEDTLKQAGSVKAVALVHAETSSGAHQPMEEIGPLCRRYGALLVVDAVTSLGGVPVRVDAWGIDACYSGTQKCLSCPPGLAPLTLSPRALEVVKGRKTKVQSWYLDLSMIADYWAEGKRAYHHTAPISMVYALREALRLVVEEGLETRFARPSRNSAALMAGLAL